MCALPAILFTVHYLELQFTHARLVSTPLISPLILLSPSSLQQMIMKDGSIRTFEVSIEQFNQLRYSVAKVRLTVCMQPSPSCLFFSVEVRNWSNNAALPHFAFFSRAPLTFHSLTHT